MKQPRARGLSTGNSRIPSSPVGNRAFDALAILYARDAPASRGLPRGCVSLPAGNYGIARPRCEPREVESSTELLAKIVRAESFGILCTSCSRVTLDLCCAYAETDSSTNRRRVNAQRNSRDRGVIQRSKGKFYLTGCGTAFASLYSSVHVPVLYGA